MNLVFKARSSMGFNRWKWPKEPAERVMAIVIIIGLILYITFWVFYCLGNFPQLDRPIGRP